MHRQRKITASLYVSLDGVVESPEQWHFPYANEEFLAALGESFTASDATLLGRRTYEAFAAYWPHQGSDVTMADQINGTAEYVVSTTLADPTWQNTTVISGNVYEQIAELKEQPGKNIAISVSATLVWSLLRAGMLDQLKLLMHPLVVGSASKRLFSESDQRAPLTFVDATTFKTDVLKLTYVPAAS